MKILIGADIVPTKSNKEAFSSGNISAIIDESLEKKLGEADFRIFNLETPLADKEAPIKKCGPNLLAPTSCINGIKKLGVDLFTLANNHIMDHGEEAFNTTLKTLSENEIAYTGAGANLFAAQKPYIINKEDKKIGVYACAEHEFTIAGENVAGANPFDVLESFDHIANLKDECDYVIVLYHGGKEYYRYPSPILQKVCRKMCDKGADLVICQHSHCIGCREEYKGSEIVYGQGNFIFVGTSNNEYWNNALLIELKLEDEASIEYIPLEKKNGIIGISEDDDILKKFNVRSKEIKKDGFVKAEYSKFAREMYDSYLSRIYGVSLLFRIVNKLCGHRLKHKKKISEERKLMVQNIIRCEAHRELFLRGVENDN